MNEMYMNKNHVLKTIIEKNVLQIKNSQYRKIYIHFVGNRITH